MSTISIKIEYIGRDIINQYLAINEDNTIKLASIDKNKAIKKINASNNKVEKVDVIN